MDRYGQIVSIARIRFPGNHGLKNQDSKKYLYIFYDKVSFVEHIQQKPGEIAEKVDDIRDTMVVVSGVVVFFIVVGIWYLFLR